MCVFVCVMCHGVCVCVCVCGMVRERERERERACSPCVDPHGYAFIDYLVGTLGPIPTLGWLSPCRQWFVIDRL